MSNINLVALRPLPSAALPPLDAPTVAALQRWCAGRNAQVIFNCDGTVYAAVDDELRHSRYCLESLSALICAWCK